MFSWTTLLIEFTWGRIKYPSTKVGFIILFIFTLIALVIVYPTKLLYKLLFNTISLPY